MKQQTQNFSFSSFTNDNPTEAKYGLPHEIKFCKQCVISNQRPNSTVEMKHKADSKKETIAFNEDGICDACLVAKEKKKIDWNLRDQELRELCDQYRSKDGSYDCIVPGSGGKDSFYQAHILKYKYDMHPLTVTWAPNIYTDWGRRNHQRWVDAGFDNYLVTPNPRMHRLLTRVAVENLFHPFQPFIFGQKYLGPKIAAMMGVSLVFYGENEAEYGNPKADMNSAKRDFKYFSSENEDEIYLGGASLKELQEKYGVKRGELDIYMPIDPQKLEDKKVEVQYLGYYNKWHPQEAYYYAVENGGFEASPERTAGTYSKYNSIDDKIDDFHYYTTYIKFGIGRATYDAAQEIRSGDIDREEGVLLVNKFDGEFPERFVDEIFKYLSINEKEYPIASKGFVNPIMDRDYFENLTNQFRSPHLWKFENNQWKLRKIVR